MKLALDRQTVDVVIPNYNRYEKLLRAVDSVLDQSTNALENIFILDDGSPDDLNESIENYYRKEKRVILKRMPHQGNPGELRKLGVVNSNSKFVAFLDSDDWWEAHKLETQLSAILDSGAIACSSNAQSWKVDGTQKFFVDHKSIPTRLLFEDLISENFVINSSMLVSRAALKQIGFYASNIKVKSVEDYATWLRLSTIGPVQYVNQVLMHYSDSDPKSSIRNINLSDPRYLAIEDFLLWSREIADLDKRYSSLAQQELLKLKDGSI
jgi:teichuronic acid biosynthesis glycosyltransferase TuaG